MEGRMDGVQVWRHTTDFRNVYSNYKDRRKTSRGIHALTNQLFEEVYGDRVQALHLLYFHNKSIILIQNLQLKTIEYSVRGLEPVVFNGEKYHTFLRECNATFESAIKQCYTNFVVIGAPLISRSMIDSLVQSYKVNMTSHYTTFFRMFGFDKKKQRNKERLLKDFRVL